MQQEEIATVLSMENLSSSQTILHDGMLSMKFNGKEIKSKFPVSLASSRYPLLSIGNDTLKSFIGDVAFFSLRTHPLRTNMKLLKDKHNVDVNIVCDFNFMDHQDVDLTHNEGKGNPMRKLSIDSNLRFAGAILNENLCWGVDIDNSLSSFLLTKNMNDGKIEEIAKNDMSVENILSSEELARHDLFKEGSKFSGSITRNVSKTLPSDITKYLLDGEGDEETNNQQVPLSIFLKTDTSSLINNDDKMLKIIGYISLKLMNQSLEYSVKGFIKLDDGKIEFNIDELPEIKWLQGLRFVGIEQLGKLEGQWMSYCTLNALPPIKENIFRANIQTCPPFIRLGNGGLMIVHDYRPVPILGNVIFTIGTNDDNKIEEFKFISEDDAIKIFKDDDCVEFFNKFKTSSETIKINDTETLSDEVKIAAALVPPVWACPACTFENDITFTTCQICGHAYESSSSDEEDQNDESSASLAETSCVLWSGKGSINRCTGIYFWEIKIGSTASSGCAIGVARPGTRIDKRLGIDKNSWAILMNGQKRSCDKSQSYAKVALKPNDIVGVEIDTDSASGGTIRFFHNGKDCGIAFEKLFDEEEVGISPCISLQRYGDMMTMLGFKNGPGSIICHQDDKLARKSFSGIWKNGICNGYGKMELPDGTIQEGIWIGENKEGCHKITRLISLKKR